MSKKERRKAKKEQAEQKASTIACNVCKEVFESKTKLFKHVNATGHALRV